MANESEADIQKEIIKRALSEEKKKIATAYTKDTLDVLEEITELPRSKLEEIASNVRTSSVYDRDSFFSVKMQVALTSGFFAIFAFSVLLIRWIF
jgi:hypothetical protein